MARKSSLGSELEGLRGKLVRASPLDSINSHAEVEAVVGVLLCEDSPRDLEVLLVQRAERSGDPWSGHIGLPGGRVKSLDESNLAACKREVLEEVGVDLEVGAELLGTLSPSYPSNRPSLKVQPWVFGLDHLPEPKVGPEIIDAFWVSLSRLSTLKTQSEVTTGAGPRLVSSFLVDGRIVWGFTYRVLSELLKVNSESSC